MGNRGRCFLVLWELSFKKAEAFGYFRPTKVPRRRQKEKTEMITEMEFNSESWNPAPQAKGALEIIRALELNHKRRNPHISTNILICSITGV